MFSFVSAFSASCKLVACAFFAVLMTGCAGLAPQSDATQTDLARNTAVRTYDANIDLDGRLSVQYQQNDKEESVHGSFTWRQMDDRSTIAILSPLGQILATIEVEPGQATLTQSGRAPRIASDVDTLTAQTLGWPLPVSGLRTWLQGFALDANDQPFAATPDNNKITTRDGWQIQYVTWDDSDPARIQPKRIDLTRQTEQAGTVAIRIVLDNQQPR